MNFSDLYDPVPNKNAAGLPQPTSLVMVGHVGQLRQARILQRELKRNGK